MFYNQIIPDNLLTVKFPYGKLAAETSTIIDVLRCMYRFVINHRLLRLPETPLVSVRLR